MTVSSRGCRFHAGHCATKQGARLVFRWVVRKFLPSAPKQHVHRHIAQWLAATPSRKTKSDVRYSFIRSIISTARFKSGTQCWRLSFMRAAGIVQSFSSRSDSSHLARSVSEDLAAVSVVNIQGEGCNRLSLAQSLRGKREPRDRVGRPGGFFPCERLPAGCFSDDRATGRGSRRSASPAPFIVDNPFDTAAKPGCGFPLRLPDRHEHLAV